MIDLHAHTTVSDGSLTPAELVAEARRAGLGALAVTDHDDVSGLAEARRAAALSGDGSPPLELVPGVELSVDSELGSVHLLGYFVDAAALAAHLELIQRSRRERNAKIVARLTELGMAVSADELQAEAGSGQVGRPHIAAVLLRHGYVDSIQDAFDRWLAEGRPAYFERVRFEIGDAIGLLHACGGVAALAHPKTKPARATRAEFEAWLGDLAAAGLDGIEVTHPLHDDADRAYYRGLAAALGLVATGGSDFHGIYKPGIALGSGRNGNVQVPDDVLESLRERAGAR